MELYIVTHPKFEGWIKLGRTVNLKNRLNSYQTGCPNRECQIVYHKLLSKDIIEVMENYFRLHMSNNGFEWYKCATEDAIEKIEKIIKGDIKTDIIMERRPYNQKFTYYAFENLDEYSYMDEKSFCSIEELVKCFKLNRTSCGTISRLFQNGRRVVKFKNLIIRRKKFVNIINGIYNELQSESF